MKRRQDNEPLTLEQAQSIENWAEQALAIVLCSIPHLLVYYEPDEFTADGKTTRPDFKVINTRRQNPMATYIEATGGKHPKLHPKVSDPNHIKGKNKNKQNLVMEKVVAHHPDIRYLQLCGREIKKVRVPPDLVLSRTKNKVR